MLEVLINQINIKHPENRLILSDILFSVEPGQVITIAGKNGSGKSTLLKAIIGLLDNRLYEVNGKVLYNGKDILSTDQQSKQGIRRNNIKYVMQDSAGSFDPLKKFKYYFDLASDTYNTELKEVEALLRFFLLPVPAKLFKLHAYEVSGGMAQRISLILALLAHPQILLLDEPTSGIDSPAANLLLHKIKEYVSTEHASVLLVTHDFRFAEKISDKIAILSAGRLSGFNSPDQFIITANSLFKNASQEGYNEFPG